MTSLRHLVAAVVLVAVAGGLPACRSDSDRLFVYSGRTEDLIKPLLEKFNDETDIQIDVRYADSAALALLIDEEGDRSPADVFLSQSPGALGFLQDDDRLLPLPEDLSGRVDPEFRGGDDEWIGLSGRVRVLVYNTEKVNRDELPRSVFDLTGPRYEDRVAVAPSNGSFQDFVTAMRQKVGDDRTAAWLKGMADNGAQPYANNTAIVQAVGRGEIDMGLVNHYYNERAKAEDADLPTENYFFPDRDLGSLILETGIGVLDTAEQIDDARALVEFLLGEEAQTYFSEETFEYPLVDGLDPPEGLVPLDQIEAPEEDLTTLGGGFRRTQELIEASGLD